MLGVRDSMQWRNGWRRDVVCPPRRTAGFRPGPIGGILALSIAFMTSGAAQARTEPTIDELKARVSSANVGDKPKICVEIAEKQLNAADKLYTADNVE